MAEDKKEKDPENKYNITDVLDWESAVRKLPVGPSIDELQESKIKSMMGGESRPASHVVKDTVATVAPVLPEILAPVLAKPLAKFKESKAVSRTLDRILDLARQKAHIPSYKEASKIGEEAFEAAKKVGTVNDELTSARRLVNNANIGVYDNEAQAILGNAKLSAKEKKALDKGIKSLEKESEQSKKVLKDALYGDHPQTEGGFNIDLRDLLTFARDETAMDRQVFEELNEKILNGTITTNDEFFKELKKYEKIENKNAKLAKKSLIKDLNEDVENEAAEKLAKTGPTGPTVKKKNVNVHYKSIGDKERSNIMRAMKKSKNYNKTFEKLINPNDVIYKQLAKKDPKIVASDRAIADYVGKGLSVPDAIQAKALDLLFERADSPYKDALVALTRADDSTYSRRAIEAQLKKHPFRNIDGTLKAEDEIVDMISKDPFYKEIIDGLVNQELQMANRIEARSTAKAIESAGLPLLGVFTKRAIDKGTHKLPDTFNKNSEDILSDDYKPYDPKLEREKGEQVFQNLLSMFSLNHSKDPSRFTTKQLSNMKDALIEANKELHLWSNPQIKGLSDGEVLDLINSIGANKYGYSAIEKVNKAYDKIIGE